MARPSGWCERCSVTRQPLPSVPDSLGPLSVRSAHLGDKVAIIVDDDEVSRKTLARVVHAAGNVAVATASQVDQVLAILRSYGPEPRRMILFAAVMLPEFSSQDSRGRQFVQRVRQAPCFGLAPVVLVSALAETTLTQYVERWGANGLIEKSKGLLHLSAECGTWINRI